MQDVPLVRATFWQTLQTSGLLTSRQLRTAVDGYGAIDDVEELARALVQHRLLTSYQARLLLAGRTRGLHLGPYRILGELGRGGMGCVYKAEHRLLRRTVALKVVAPNLLPADRPREFLFREVEAAGRLWHPNIVRAYDAGEVDGRFYLALEYVPGPDLERYVRQRGVLPCRLACEVVRQTAVGLQAAHDLGMVHRDIKPANLIITHPRPKTTPSTPVVKILDFGLARLHPIGEKVLGGRTKTILAADNVLVGTPDYMAPEQAHDVHDADVRSDLYSLGCTFYFLLTGQAPFEGGGLLEKMVRHQLDEPAPADRLRPGLPSAVVRIVARLLQKDPAARFQSPDALVQALAPHALAGRSAAPV